MRTPVLLFRRFHSRKFWEKSCRAKKKFFFSFKKCSIKFLGNEKFMSGKRIWHLEDFKKWATIHSAMLKKTFLIKKSSFYNAFNFHGMEDWLNFMYLLSENFLWRILNKLFESGIRCFRGRKFFLKIFSCVSACSL